MKLKMVLSLVLVLVLSLSIFCVVNAEEKELGPILTEVKETGVIKFAMISNRPPWYFHIIDKDGNDNTEGFEAYMIEDITKLIGDYLGIECKAEIMETNVAGVLAAIQAGKSQLALSLAPTAERRENMDFTSYAYHRSLQCIAIRKDDADKPELAAENGLKGMRIASTLGSSTTVTLKEKYPDCEVVDLDSSVDNLIALVTGKVDGAVFNQKLGILYCKSNDTIMLKDDLSYEIPIERDPGSCIGFQYKNEDLKGLLDEYITRILSDGTFKSYEDRSILALNDESVLEDYDVNLGGEAVTKAK